MRRRRRSRLALRFAETFPGGSIRLRHADAVGVLLHPSRRWRTSRARRRALSFQSLSSHADWLVSVTATGGVTSHADWYPSLQEDALSEPHPSLRFHPSDADVAADNGASVLQILQDSGNVGEVGVRLAGEIAVGEVGLAGHAIDVVEDDPRDPEDTRILPLRRKHGVPPRRHLRTGGCWLRPRQRAGRHLAVTDDGEATTCTFVTHVQGRWLKLLVSHRQLGRR